MIDHLSCLSIERNEPGSGTIRPRDVHAIICRGHQDPASARNDLARGAVDHVDSSDGAAAGILIGVDAAAWGEPLVWHGYPHAGRPVKCQAGVDSDLAWCAA